MAGERFVYTESLHQYKELIIGMASVYLCIYAEAGREVLLCLYKLKSLQRSIYFFLSFQI